MKKLFLLLTLSLIGLTGYSQDVITIVKGKKWYKPDAGYGQDTLQSYIIQNKNSGGNAGFAIIVGADTVFLQLDSLGNYYIINRTGDITFIAEGGDVISRENLTIGDGTAVDFKIVFDGLTSDGTITYDEDQLEFIFNRAVDINGALEARDVTLDNAAAVLLFSSATSGNINSNSGLLTIAGVNGTNNENAILDLETTPNSIDVGTSTGVTKWDFGTIGVESAYLDADDSLTLNGITVDSIITLANATGNAGAPFDTVKTGVIKSNVTTYSVMNGEVTAGGCVTLTDDASITLPDAKTQSLVVYVDGDNEWALAAIQADGTVTLPATVGSVVNSDTDTNLCIFDSGTGATIRNRLGSTKTICYTTKYKQ